jgi:uncharacterized protein (DUF779 family)
MASREVTRAGAGRIAARGGRQVTARRVVATTAAREAVSRLRAVRGPLMFVQSAGCCGGSAPMCFSAGEYLTGPGDLLLGTVAGCPFYMDARTYEAWHPGQLVLDVEPGFPEGFSLAAGDGTHFVTRTADQDRRS